LCLAEQGKELKDLFLYWMPSKASSGRCSLDFETARVETDFYIVFIPSRYGWLQRLKVKLEPMVIKVAE